MSSWLTGWSYRKSHEIVGSTAGSQTDYQIRIKVHYSSGTDSGEDVYLNGKCRTDFGDIRFTSDDGVTEISHWMEEKVDGDYAIFWVKADSIPASPDTATIYIYYGNPSAESVSNGENTFLFFDDFEGTSLDTNKWEVSNNVGDGTLEIADSVAHQYARGGSYHIRINTANYTLPENFVVERKVKIGTYADANNNNRNRFGIRGVSLGFDHGIFDGPDHPTIYYFWNGYTGIATTLNTWMRMIQIVWGTTYTWRTPDIERSGTVTKTPPYAATSLVGDPNKTTYGGDIYTDWIFIRKYIYPEPSHGAWGSEETPAVAYEITLAESLSLADIAVKSSSIVKAETLGLSDVYARVYSGHRSFVETLSLTDMVQSAVVALKQLTETISLSDYMAKNVSVVKTEALSLSDVYTRVFNAYRTLSEALTLTDTVQALKVALVTLTETISISDYIIKNMRITKAETISLIDAYSRVLTALRELTEQLAVSDALITSKTLVRELTESINLIDTALKAIGKELSESVSLSDRIAAFKPLVRTLVETLNLIDSLIRFRLRKAVRLRAAVRELPAVREREAES